jgi:hypothetical protein
LIQSKLQLQLLQPSRAVVCEVNHWALALPHWQVALVLVLTALLLCWSAGGVLSLKFISEGKLEFFRLWYLSLLVATATVKACRQTNWLDFLTICHLGIYNGV